MTTIDLRLADIPDKVCFAFPPGERIKIQINFLDDIPFRYRLQILDQRSNSRLNQYGKGLEKGIELNWKIPNNIRNEHMGMWSIKLKDQLKATELINCIFFVEKVLRAEPILLTAGQEFFILNNFVFEFTSMEYSESVLKQIDSETLLLDNNLFYVPVDKINELDSLFLREKIKEYDIPVTRIKGLGKTYAERLKELEIVTIEQFFNYPDRKILAATMRVNVNKVMKFITEIEAIFEQQGVTSRSIPVGIQPGEDTNGLSLMEISGIGPRFCEKLTKIGIKTKEDLMNFNDYELLAKTLRMSNVRLSKFLKSLGKKDSNKSINKPMNETMHELEKIPGIGPKYHEKLEKLGIKTRTDLKNYHEFTDLEILRKSLRMSLERIIKLIESL